MISQLMMLPLVVVLGAAGNEVVLVIDNSGSMAAGGTDSSGKTIPANDPERAAPLGALIVQGLASGSEDKITVMGFGEHPGSPPKIVSTPDAIRGMRYVGGTFFGPPLTESRRILEGSSLDRRLFIFFTDGAPNDLKDPAEGPQLLGLAENPAIETMVIGLYGSAEAKETGQAFLRPLARNAEDLVFVQRPQEIVAVFTRGYARVLGSRPETGTLSPNANRSFNVGKYVVEVLAAVASSKPGDPFTVKLTGPSGEVPVRASGDNGCPNAVRLGNAPKLCEPPRRHYQVFRASNDPEKASNWTLTLSSGSGDVDFGLIVRYDLTASLSAPTPVRVGASSIIEASLLFRGKIFDDAAFFAADGFVAEATAGGQPVALKHVGGGKFTGSWVPTEPNPALPIKVAFRNNWMEKTASQQVAVEGFLDLVLVPQPAELELGSWRGDRSETRRCQTIDLSASTNADKIPITCSGAGQIAAGAMSCQPVVGSEADLGGGKKGQPMKWEVCFAAPGCCGPIIPQGTLVKLAGTNPHYAPGAVDVPVKFKVDETGWLRCYWIWLALAGALLFSIWFIAGWVRPKNFDPAASVVVAGSELGLKRASALGLRELPGGSRGFYRNARVCLNADGDVVRSPRMAVIVLEASGAGTTRFKRAAGLEMKDKRTSKFNAVPATELEQGYVPNAIYRVGSLHLKFG